MVPLDDDAPLTVAAEPGQMVCVPPAEAVGANLMVRTIVSETALQGPVGSFVVKVRVMLPPAAISPAEGVYTAFNVLLSGLKVPAPPDQVPDVALPPTEPAKVTFGLVAQTV